MPETQAFSAPRSRWSPPTGTLGGLVQASFARASALASQDAELLERAGAAPAAASFRDALRKQTVAVIAEVKRRSPSKGSINPQLDAVARARSYVAAGASAISVLTEPQSFGGSMADLADVAAAVSVPVIRKDFIVAPVQLYEARAMGASAALLIARALSPAALTQLYQVGISLGMDLLVEVRDATELARAIDAGANIIGVNNRNLETLEMDPGTVDRIMPLIPRDVVTVAESGMRSRDDVVRAARAGAEAVLIGSAISALEDPGDAVRSLADVAVERDVHAH